MDEITKPTRKYTKKDGVKYGRPKKKTEASSPSLEEQKLNTEMNRT